MLIPQIIILTSVPNFGKKVNLGSLLCVGACKAIMLEVEAILGGSDGRCGVVGRLLLRNCRF